jgi:hypothetical protein
MSNTGLPPVIRIQVNQVSQRKVPVILACSLRKYMFLIIPFACIVAITVSEPLWEHLEFKAYDARVQFTPIRQSRHGCH